MDDSDTPEPDDLRERRKNLKSRRFPHIVATINGTVVGYSYVVLFRKRPAYHYTVKHSIYVHHDHIGKGVGSQLRRGLIDAWAAVGFRQIIGYIDADNAASLALHERFNFVRVGLLPSVAYRYGRWADSVMVRVHWGRVRRHRLRHRLYPLAENEPKTFCKWQTPGLLGLVLVASRDHSRFWKSSTTTQQSVEILHSGS